MKKAFNIKRKLYTKILIGIMLGALTVAGTAGCGTQGRTGGSTGSSASGFSDNVTKDSKVNHQFDFSEVIAENGDVTDDYDSLGTLTFFNNKYFGLLFGVENYSLQEILEVADNNKNIPDNYRAFINDYIADMYNYYPELDWRVFVCNLSTVTFDVKDADDPEYYNRYGSYVIDNNNIVIRADLDVENDDNAIRTLRHEFSHMINSLVIRGLNGYTVKYAFNRVEGGYRGEAAMECMNSILAAGPFYDSYTDKKRDYAGMTELVMVAADCTNYKIEDSVNYNITYFEANLDKYLKDGKTGMDFTENLQYYLDLAKTGTTDVTGHEEIAYLYETVAELYIQKYVTADMTEEQIREEEDKLDSILLQSVSNPENVYTDTVHDTFTEYIENK